MKKTFTIEGEVVRYPGPGGWYFVQADKEISDELRRSAHTKKVGWGYIKVKAKVGETSWETTLFPTKNNGPYLIAIKTDVRKVEHISEKDTVRINVALE
ncbi:MAG TPA: DUF1905 domain-containing protein [Candidatus Paceibacterota bacterium]|nr:DUF1905 domain-containing protein [Candidatus Paceibacterota bacterium]